MSAEDEILSNEAALGSLKRSQLLSLSRKYGLRGSGKNTDLILRLQEFAQTLVTSNMSLEMTMTEEDPSMAVGMETYENEQEDEESYQYTSSPAPQEFEAVTAHEDDDATSTTFGESSHTPQQSPFHHRNHQNHPLFLPPPQPSPRTHQPRTMPEIPSHLLDQVTADSPLRRARARPSSVVSEMTAKQWEVIDHETASIASPGTGGGRWKSVGNGESLGKKIRLPGSAPEDFGIPRSESAGSSSSRTKTSLKALACSLRKSTSKVLLHNETPAKANAEPATETEAPPSPAPTVGIPKRHPHASTGANTTIRMVSSTSLPLSPSTPSAATETNNNNNSSPDWNALTPMQGMARYQPPISPVGSQASTIATTVGHGRNGSFAGTVLGSQASGFFGRGSIQSPGNGAGGLVMGSASLAQVYPPLPILPSQYAQHKSPPGAFPSSPFVFGSPLPRNGISNEEFSSAGLKVLEEMNARLGGRGIGVTLGPKLLKGRGGVVKTHAEIGGFGLKDGKGNGKKDRYAEAHEREFAKMASISTHAAARRGMSVPPSRPTTSAHSTLTSRSTVTLPLSTSSSGRPKRKLATAATTPSAPNGLPLVPSEDAETAQQGRYKRSRLSVGSAKALGSIREAGASVVRLMAHDGKKDKMQETTEMMRKLREKRRSMAGLAAKARRISGRLGLTRKDPETLLPQRKKFDLQASLRRGSTSVREYVRRNSASSVDLLSVSSMTSKASASTAPPSRSSMATKASIAKASTAPSVVSTKSSGSTPLKPRAKLPNFEMAPPPVPKLATAAAVPHLLRPAGPRQHSLHAPTASSLARMQATVKPRATKSSMTPSQSSILSPANKANQGAPTPVKSAMRPKNPPSGTPIQSARAAARSRAKGASTGLSAVKSTGNLKAELEVQARKNEIKARRERVNEQRKLEEMLSLGKAL